MKENSLASQCAGMIKELISNANSDHKIDDTNVYQPANPKTRQYLNVLIDNYFLPESHIAGLENFKEFHKAIKEGKRGLILSEHFSNMDAPAITYLLERAGTPETDELAKDLVAIAGVKLNETNPMVKALAESFTRIVIYPSRSLASITDPAERAEEEAKSRRINTASMHALTDCRKNGRPVLVFPSGTRFREGKPETRKGVREIDSYIRMFDVMIFVSINGNCLRIDHDDPENMLADLLTKDTVVVTGSPVIDCKEFRKQALAECDETVEDKKQYVVSKVMERLIEQHDKQKPYYQEVYKKATGKDTDYLI